MTDSTQIETFGDAVLQAVAETECIVARSILESACPHREHALVASYGVLTKDSCSLVLKPEDFGPYVVGHPWMFPAHWLNEMAALAAGFQAKRAICEAKGLADCLAYTWPVVVQSGEWAKQPPACSTESGEPITATVQNFEIHIGGTVRYTADVLFRQGDREAVFAGMKVIMKKGR